MHVFIPRKFLDLPLLNTCIINSTHCHIHVHVLTALGIIGLYNFVSSAVSTYEYLLIKQCKR